MQVPTKIAIYRNGMADHSSRAGHLGWALSAFIALLAVPFTTEAADWKQISAADSPIYFANEQVIGYHGTGWSDDYSKKEYLINAEKSDGPRGMVYLSVLAPNYFFSRIAEPKGVTSSFNFLKSETQITGAQKSHNHPLQIRYVLAKRGLRDCILFVGKSGQGGGDGQTSEGTSVVHGYFCSDPDDGMSETELLWVVDQVGTKSIGAAAPGPRPVRVEKSEQPEPRVTTRDPSVETKLRDLKTLWEKNLISKEDYDQKRKEILDKSFQ